MMMVSLMMMMLLMMMMSIIPPRQAERAQTLSVETVKQKANVAGEGEKDGGAGVETFTDAEIGAALEKMMNDNQIMTADDMVFLI